MARPTVAVVVVSAVVVAVVGAVVGVGPVVTAAVAPPEGSSGANDV